MIRKIFKLIITAMILLSTTVFAANDETYTYVSKDFGYTIKCPKKPLGVMMAGTFYENRTGDILIFDFNDEDYSIRRAWVIIVDAFNTNAVPDFNKDSDKIINQYLVSLQTNGYEGTALIDVSKNNKGVFAVTAKEIEIDEDGDGKPDGTAVANRQEAVIFFRTPTGRCISTHLMSDDLTESALKNFRLGVSTLKDIDSEQSSSSDKKNDKKSKKDKQSKKDKKK